MAYNDDLMDLAPNQDYNTRLQAMKRTVTADRGQRVAGMSRDYAGMSPDLAAAFAVADIDPAYEGIGEIVRRDMQGQSWFTQAVNKIGTATRPLTAGMYDLWDSGVSQPLRFGVRSYQDMMDGGDFSLTRSFDQSIGSIAAESAIQMREGNLTPGQLFGGEALGTGLMVGRDENPMALPGAGREIANQLSQGATMSEAMSYTEKWIRGKYGADVVNGAWQNAEAVRLRVTTHGVEYDYGVSLGRMFATPLYNAQILTPDTVPANLITGTLDTASQVWLDPTDIAFDGMTQAWARMRRLQPDEVSSYHELMEVSGGQRLTSYGVDGPSVPGVSFRGGDSASGTAPAVSRLEEAVADARANDDGYVHLYRDEDLAKVDPEQIDMPELTDYQREVKTARLQLEVETQYLRDTNPQFAEALDDGVDPFEAVKIWGTEDEAADLANALIDDDVAKANLDVAKQAIPDPEDVAAPFAAIPVADAEEMLKRQYLFTEGRGAMDEAFQYVDDEWGVARVRGRWEAKSPEAFVASQRGRSLVKWLGDQSIPEYKKYERLRSAGVPQKAIIDMLDGVADEALDASATSARITDHVTAWVNGQQLTTSVAAPNVYRAVDMMPSSTSRILGEVGMTKPVRAFSDWGRRWAAHSTRSQINMWDFDTTYETVVQFLRTINASDEVIDRAMRTAWDGREQFEKAADVQAILIDELAAAWRRKDIDDDLISETLSKYFGEQRMAVLYNVDAAANPIAEADTIFRIHRTPGGLEFRVPVEQPLLNSEMSMSALHVPSIRETRRATSGGRNLRRKVLNPDSGMLLDDAVLTRLADGGLAIWRNGQLMRPGWMMSVVPDEILRAMADGHSDLFANPFTAFKVFFQGAGDTLPSGRSLDEVASADGGLGAGNFQVDIHGDPITEVTGSSRVPWQAVDTFAADGVTITREGSEALTREWLRLYHSDFGQLLDEYDSDVERVLEYLVQPGGEGRKIIDEMQAGGGKGAYPSKDIRLGKLDPDTEEGRAAIKVALEAVNARLHLFTGGDWIKRDVSDPAKWVDSAGQRVELYDGLDKDGNPWTRQRMIDEIQAKAAARGEPKVTGITGELKADLQARLLEMDDHTRGILDVPADSSYHIFKHGDPALRSVLHGGKLSPETIPRFDARARVFSGWGDDVGVTEGNRVFLVADDTTMLDEGIFAPGVRVVKSAREAATKAKPGSTVYLVDMTASSIETQLRLMEALPGGRLIDEIDSTVGLHRMDPDQIRRASDEVIAAGDQPMIWDGMEVEDIETLARYIETGGAYTDGYRPPSRVKAPSKIMGERRGVIGGWVDKVFDIIGTKPSHVAARNPYSRIKTWEGMADGYIHASPPRKAQILAAARRAKFTPDEFQAIVRRQMRIQGYTTMPAPAKVQFTVDELEQIAVAKAVQDTRDLFFDLSKRSNIWDATKIIFPFGDAWWEVLSRWGRLFNPVKAQEFGRPFKNISRLESASVGAQRSGWFDTDAQGNRVFSWFPGAAMAASLLGAPEGMNVTNQAGLSQMMFIDPTDPRGIMGPSTSPAIQTAAALTRPLYEDKSIAPLINWFTYGSYSPTEATSSGIVDGFLPTYMRKGWHLLETGEYDEHFASRQIDFANGMFSTGDPKYAAAMTDADAMDRLMRDSQQFTTHYSIIEMAASAFLPAQPRAVVEVFNADTAGSDQAQRLAAVSADYNFLSEYMSDEEVMAAIYQWYGLNPLEVGAKSYSIEQRPVTETSYRTILANPELPTVLPYTMAAFIPEETDDGFYNPEYERQMATGERQKLSARESFELMSYRGGADRMAEIRDERDMKLYQAEELLGKDSDAYRMSRDQTAVWYNTARNSIETAYFYETGAGGPAGLRKRPTYEDLKDEMLAIGSPGTPQHRVAFAADPQITLALEKISSLWLKNESMSMTFGHEPTWWYAGTATSDPTTAQMRSSFQYRVTEILRGISDESVKRQVQWYTDTVVTPLMTGYDLDDPFIVDVEPLLAPGG